VRKSRAAYVLWMAGALGAALFSEARAQVEPSEDSIPVYSLDPITVLGRADDLTGQVSSASVGYVGQRDLATRPLLREGELLETVPGMILTQHSGGGKANQVFVRGFNLDHGTDFATWLEGMPVNIVTHAHGHGYMDLNFLIPELVDHIEYSLGNYYASIGDFGAAGGAQFRLRDRLDGPIGELGYGADGYQRILVGGSTDLASLGTVLVASELKRNDGPWDIPEDLDKFSGMARYTHTGRSSTFSLLGLGYHNTWHASDQIPLRAVASGSIDRFGQIDPTLHGKTRRYSVSGTWTRAGETSSQHVDVYAIHYMLDLLGNFTYELDDPVDGDQHRQRDRGRWTTGANLAHLQSIGFGGLDHSLTVGAQLRRDVADVSLDRSSGGTPLYTVRRDDVDQWSAGAYAQLESPWSRWLRTTIGLRGDLYRFDVTSDRPENTGRAASEILSPKLSLAFLPSPSTELYVSGGMGFHSNDARGAVSTVDPGSGDSVDPVAALVRSRGAEVGMRTSAVAGLRSTLALWTVELDSELRFVGDVGTTEASDPSRRFGVTMANFYRITDEWTVDADVSFTRARFTNVDPGQDRIPGAIENVIAAGVSRMPIGNGVFGSVRLRQLGPYALLEDGSKRAASSSLVNVELGYRLGGARLHVSLLNALDEESSDIQYYYTSRLAGEPAGGVDDVHFHPAEPRQLRMGLSWGM
jgi:hypothetical protein